jgi:hypothetical protein
LLKQLKHFCIYRKENGSYKPFVPLATSSYIRNPMFCKWCQTVSDFPLSVRACSFGLSATSQHYFSLRTNQPPAISQ